MDKVKVFLVQMKKHHFWVMTGSVLIMALVAWFLATSKLLAEYEANRSKITREFEELRTLTSQERENQKWLDGTDVETGKLKITVRSAWDNVYTHQRDKVLKWPDALGEYFLSIMKTRGPSDEIPLDLRELYYNYIKAEFPRLLGIVDARSYLNRATPGVADPEESGPPHDYKMIWNYNNQEELDRKLDWTDTPTTQQVRFAQEDLWVYQALLTILANLNDRATGHHNAKIKELQEVLIGREAALRFQNGVGPGWIMHPGAVATGPPGSPGAVGQPQVPRSLPSNPSAPGAPGGAAPLDEGRYVDEKGKPLAAGATAPPEFKRMPVYFRLLIDQREISRLLVECANSPLPVEVRQLRISSTGGTPMTGGGSSKGGGPGGYPGPGPKQSSAPRIVQGPSGDSEGDAERDKNPYDVIAEVQGIIYIFNPPDDAKLAVAPAPGAAVDPAAAEPVADAGPGEAPAEGEAPAGDAAAPADDAGPAAKPAADAEGAAGEAPADAEDAAAETEDDKPDAVVPAAKEKEGVKADGEEPAMDAEGI